MIGVITEDITSFITPQIVDGIDAWCEEHDIFMLVQNLRVYQKYAYNLENYLTSKESLQRIVDMLVAHQVNGIIYIGDQYREVSDIIPKIQIPLLCVQCYAEGVSAIAIDNEEAAYQMTKYILEKGHTEIGVITGILKSSEMRMRGVIRALEERGLELEPQWIFQGEWTYQSGVYAAEKLLKLTKLPSAVFAFSDTMAAGLISAFQETGDQRLKEISVAGFDNHIAEYCTPRLTTIAAPFQELGYESAKMLERKIGGDEAVIRRYMPCKLVIRDSVNPK